MPGTLATAKASVHPSARESLASAYVNGGRLGPMPSRAFGKDRNDALRARVRAIMTADFGGNLTATAKALGLSPAALHDFLGETRGAGMKLLDGLAKYSGLSVDALISGAPTPALAAPRWGDLPGWAQARADALRVYGRRLPEIAFEHAGDVMGMAPPSVVDARTVYNAAKLWWDARTEEEQEAAIATQARAEMAAEDAAVDALLKSRAEAQTRGEPLPPLQAAVDELLTPKDPKAR